MSDKRSTETRKGALERVSETAGSFTGGSTAFASAAGVVVLWAACGPFFGFSDSWQLFINTGTTIVTFLMVFLIQRSQNKESLAVQLKLNEIVAALHGASNRLIDAEQMGESELDMLRSHYKRLVTLAESDACLTESHSVEEAEERHEEKSNARS